MANKCIRKCATLLIMEEMTILKQQAPFYIYSDYKTKLNHSNIKFW